MTSLMKRTAGSSQPQYDNPRNMESCSQK